MTKKRLLITVALVLGIIAIVESGILNALMIFLLVGALPGTALSIPPFAMLLFVGGAIIALTHWVAAKQLYPGSPKVKASQDKVLRRTARHDVRRAKNKRNSSKLKKTTKTNAKYDAAKA